MRLEFSIFMPRTLIGFGMHRSPHKLDHFEHQLHGKSIYAYKTA